MSSSTIESSFDFNTLFGNIRSCLHEGGMMPGEMLLWLQFAQACDPDRYMLEVFPYLEAQKELPILEVVYKEHVASWEEFYPGEVVARRSLERDFFLPAQYKTYRIPSHGKSKKQGT